MPRIGLLSDSHGRAGTTRRGVALLLEAGASCLIHLGDVGSYEVLDALLVHKPGTDQQIQAHVVFGNTDWNIPALTRYARDIGLIVDHPAGRLALEGGDLMFCHGHEIAPMQQAIDERVRYLCHGHTHRAADQRRGATRVINPGALFRAAEYSVAILDTDQDELVFLSIPNQ